MDLMQQQPAAPARRRAPLRARPHTPQSHDRGGPCPWRPAVRTETGRTAAPSAHQSPWKALRCRWTRPLPQWPRDSHARSTCMSSVPAI
eukprot:scaffold2036_cov115-Isochrysis_galbana.AAC.13